MQRFSTTLAVVVSLLLAAPARDARGATLASLVGGGTLETALLKFDSFTYSFAGGPAASTINVNPVTFSADLQGLAIDGQFSVTTPFAQGAIGYRVTGKSGSTIHSASLAGNPVASPAGFTTVNELFSGGLTELSIYSQSGETSTFDMTTFAPRTGVTVNNVLRFSGAVGSPSTLTLVEELFGVATEDGADFNEDNDVDGADFLTWQRNLGLTGAVNMQGDANGDGNVDEEDLAIWRETFGPQSPVQSIPEPCGGALAMAGLGAGALIRLRQVASCGTTSTLTPMRCSPPPTKTP
jgi:hypothetical protein